ncbi:leucine--tRNA ligase [Saccharomycopsis crataegensis]|uniref:leucine--tRNA ligase n=1 Tax=Saccharomycopsis crataegensis TaxID=43959 RepID=A0AAV5QHA7_9ASCO|nr:leucine--tRNA ligase [Saccharomycopsis crataegensis]
MLRVARNPAIISRAQSVRLNVPSQLIKLNRLNLSTSSVLQQVKFPDLDRKWLKNWEKFDGPITPKPLPGEHGDKEKYYMLTMFPYPSGMLHMGHFRVFTITDVVARFHRFKNKEVINPMGWDSFGLPAENAAIQNQVDPKFWTQKNIGKMRHQIGKMSTSFDWDRELSTCDKSYYKFTQMLFLWLYENGLAYKNLKEINWDPIDQTVLANEQVDANGKSWRSGAIVEKKMLNQWFLKITDFAKDLSDDLKKLDNWPQKVKLMQQNWIGKSTGANIKFTLGNDEMIEVFTSRPDTLFSVQYLAISIDHPLSKQMSVNNQELQQFIDNAKEQEKQQSFSHESDQQKNKDGYELPGIHGIHPLTGKKMPIFVAPYVLSSYGNGAVMGCPGHDERDWDFWLQNASGKPVIKTVDPVDIAELDDSKPYLGKQGTLNNNCAPEFQGLTAKQGYDKIVATLQSKSMGGPATNFKLRDWSISRQRYWGCPIPMIYCDSCGMVPVPEDQLPVVLPENIEFTGKGNPLDQHSEFKNCKCPKCGSNNATRETDTMDTFMDSSWYFFRYLDNNNGGLPFAKSKVDEFMPAKLYIGGVEHAILHLLYSRFISKFLYKIGKWDGGGVENNGEPFKKLASQGMVHGKTYNHPVTKKFLKPEELDKSDPNKVKLVEVDPATGEQLIPEVSYEKMSKSKFNGVDPVEFIGKYGADSTRAHMLFQAPIDLVLYWDENKIVGVQRWLKKLLNMNKLLLSKLETSKSQFNTASLDEFFASIDTHVQSKSNFNDLEIALFNETQSCITAMDSAFGDTLSLNTVISDYMKMTNSINNILQNDCDNVDLGLITSGFYKLVLMISPVCPAVCEEIWESVQKSIISNNNDYNWQSIFTSHWPVALAPKISEVTNYNVIVNGKFKFLYRGTKDLIEKPESQVFDKILNDVEGNDKKTMGDLQGKITKVILKPGAICFVGAKNTKKKSQ